MKILVISDSHGMRRQLEKVINKAGKIDMLIHLGDVETDVEYIRKYAGCETHIIRGNNDYNVDVPNEEILQIGKYKVWLTHGHRYHVNWDLETIADEAAGIGMDIVMFGHIHVPLVEYRGSVILVNPGSISLPRQNNRKGSYILMETDSEQEAHFSIAYL